MNKWPNTRRYSCFLIRTRTGSYPFRNFLWLWKAWGNGLAVRESNNNITLSDWHLIQYYSLIHSCSKFIVSVVLYRNYYGFYGQQCTYPLIICYEQQCTYILISWCIADEELLKMVQDVSEDPVYHTIEFNEFLQLLSKQQRSGTTRDSLTDAFRFVLHF